MKARCILFTGIGGVTLGETNVPDPDEGEVLIETDRTCISPGAELSSLAGRQPDAPPWPFIPGFMLVGHIVACGPHTPFKEETAVICSGTSKADVNRYRGGHISHAVRNACDVVALPEGMNLLHSSVAKLAAITHHGLRLGSPQPGENVAVIGLGVIGQLSARLHAMAGARVVAADLSPHRVAQARAMGVEAVVAGSSLSAAFKEAFPDGADIVVDATGSPTVLREALEIAEEAPWDDSPNPSRPRLIVQGSYPGDFALPYPAAFTKELALHVPRAMQPRDLRTALDLIHTGKLQVADLISTVRSPEEAPQAYAELSEPNTRAMTFAFRWKTR